MTTFRVYHGAAKPLTAVGKHQCKLLQFAEAYPGWHSFAQDRTTKRAVNGLVRRGSIMTNAFNQFCITYAAE